MCLDQSPRRFIAAWLSCYLKGVLDIYTCRPPWPPSIQGHQLVAGLLFGFLGGNSTTKRTFKKKTDVQHPSRSTKRSQCLYVISHPKIAWSSDMPRWNMEKMNEWRDVRWQWPLPEKKWGDAANCSKKLVYLTVNAKKFPESPTVGLTILTHQGRIWSLKMRFQCQTLLKEWINIRNFMKFIHKPWVLPNRYFMVNYTHE